MLTIRLFGKLTVAGPDGAEVPIAGAKTQGLVAYLALNTGMPPSRDRLMALFWGDRFPEQARQSLRQAISKLRRSFDGDADTIRTEGDRVGFAAEAVSVDVDRFAELAADPAPEAAIRAIELMEGPLLDGLYGQQSDFEDWIVSERQRFGSLACRVFERAAEAQLKAGNADAALDTARRLVALDPLRDASHMVLVRILAQSGERAAAIQHYKLYEAQLMKELGVGPGHELQRLMSEIRGEAFMAPVEAAERLPEPGPTEAEEVAQTTRPAIAVVPFATIMPGAEENAFAEGLCDDITTNLSRFRWLDVRASPGLGGKRLTASELGALGRDLGLDYIVHGSLRTLGPNLRLTVQLAEPGTGRYLWVTRYDRAGETLDAVLDELAETIAASVEAELERLAGRAARTLGIDEMNAWDCYHRGLAIQYEFAAETNAEAQRYFRRAVELNPNFAAAYARLSYAMVISAIYFEAGDVAALLDEALELARKSCRLDPDDAVGRFALGRVYLARGEYDRSLAELRTATELNPNMAQAHCGLGDSLAYAGELDRAMPCFDEAVRLSPADPYRWAFLAYGATALLFKEDFEAAADWAERAEAVPNSHYWSTAIKASALGNLGEAERAAQAVAELKERRPGITCAFVAERLFYLRDPKQLEIYVGGLRKAGLD
ncbi:BTAD domain-containing putative transcriptional regulator [Defluviimonas salinarum]|uniref:Tetratricopeptide repeat protein n=1 Tax=Defluviimonas salinarum TaxID=2992147 RepID=A0ABT3IZY1_9RHOB|nr:BTAD domain-containing putative transcriptional regulator [Defluviimonas salinarum]MCW3780980.1 tetratricopeptide repeat protein [Defluviimonas salinarum]